VLQSTKRWIVADPPWHPSAPFTGQSQPAELHVQAIPGDLGNMTIEKKQKRDVFKGRFKGNTSVFHGDLTDLI